MKAKRSCLTFSLLLVVLFSSCLGSNKNRNMGSISRDPSFLSLIFYPSKGNEGLGEARFRLELDSIVKDSIVINRDSLPFGTRIDSVTAAFSFVSSSKLVLSVDNNEKVIKHNAKVEGIDFSKSIKLINTSEDKKKSRTYQIKVNLHTVDPDLYQWDLFKDKINSSAGKNQKALMFGDKFLFFSFDNTANKLSLFESADAVNWNDKNINFNPAKPRLKTLTNHKEQLYLLDANAKLYKLSADASTWEDVNTASTKLANLLFSFKGKIWGIESSDNTYFFTSSEDGSSWTRAGQVPLEFPILDYSALVFKTNLGNPRVILLGSKEVEGKSLKTRWSTLDPAGNWTKYPEANDTLATANNAAIVKYDNRLVLFGGENLKGESIGILESYNGGWTWKTPNEEQMSLPEELKGRLETSAFVSKDNKQIYIVGGVKGGTSFSDVWRVHLNKINFKGYK